MRRRDADDAPEFDHRTNERIRLDHSPCFDVLEHRRLMSANSFRTGDALFQRNAEANSKRFANGLSLPHHIRGERARRPEFANILQRRMRQRADRIEARIAPEFRPYLGAYLVNDRRLESGLPESFRNTANSFAFRSIDLS